MNFNVSNRLRTMLVGSILGLSTFSNNALADQPVIVNVNSGNSAPQDSVGDYLVKKQVAKDMKANRKNKTWTAVDTGVELLAAVGLAGGFIYNAKEGNLEQAYNELYFPHSEYYKNPLQTIGVDKTEKKTVADWEIDAETWEKLAEDTMVKTYATSMLTKRNKLEQGVGDDKEPDDLRIYAANKTDGLSKKTMKADDTVWKSKYRYDRIKDKEISKIQSEFIKTGYVRSEVDKKNIVICASPLLALVVPAIHVPIKLTQKVTSSVGKVIDKQQNISAIKAARS